jgi:hypothetical protein
MAEKQTKKSTMELLDLRNTDIFLPEATEAERATLDRIVVWNQSKRKVVDASYIIIEFPNRDFKLVIGCKNNMMWVGKAAKVAANQGGSVSL